MKKKKTVILVCVFLFFSCGMKIEKDRRRDTILERVWVSDEVYRVIKEEEKTVTAVWYEKGGIMDSTYLEFYANGLLKRRSNYEYGQKHGEEFFYFDSLMAESREVKVEPSEIVFTKPSRYLYYDHDELAYAVSYGRDGNVLSDEGRYFVMGSHSENESIECQSNSKSLIWYRLVYPPYVKISIEKKIEYLNGIREDIRLYPVKYDDIGVFLQDSLSLENPKKVSYIVSIEQQNETKSEDTVSINVFCN